MANKIKYNLRNVYYAPMVNGDVASDGTATYSTPVRWNGAVNISLEAQGSSNTFYADGIAYYVTQKNDGYSGDFESALVPESFKEDTLGEVKDSKGVFIETSDSKVKHFALIFQFDGDVSDTYHVLYNCTVNRPSLAGATSEDSIEAQTETVTITATTIYDSTLKKNIVKSRTSDDTDSSVKGAWFDAVQMPNAVVSA